MKDMTIKVFYSEEDKGFIALNPVTKLNAFGNSPSEALKELSIVYQMVEQVLEEDR